jgi:hypothetical protein
MTTGIHVPRHVLVLLRRVAAERANQHGGRASVSAVLVDLVRANAAKLEEEVGGGQRGAAAPRPFQGT